MEEFLDFLPEEERRIVEQLREIIFSCLPDAKEKLAYNVPFYYGYNRICYIWPGSVPWGRSQKKGVDLGFCKGHLLADSSYLSRGGRKEVYIKTFQNTRQISTGILSRLLYEAAGIDGDTARNKNIKKISPFRH